MPTIKTMRNGKTLSGSRAGVVTGGNGRDGSRVEGRGSICVTCDQCGIVCLSAVHLARHLADHEDSARTNPTYTCSACNRKFPFLMQLNQHQQSCRSKAGGLTRSGGESSSAGASSSLRCKVCRRQFTQCGALRRHERTHSDDRPHACRACGKRFIQKCTLERHVQLVHDGNADESCTSGRRRGRRNRKDGKAPVAAAAGPAVATTAERLTDDDMDVDHVTDVDSAGSRKATAISASRHSAVISPVSTRLSSASCKVTGFASSASAAKVSSIAGKPAPTLQPASVTARGTATVVLSRITFGSVDGVAPMASSAALVAVAASKAATDTSATGSGADSSSASDSDDDGQTSGGSTSSPSSSSGSSKRGLNDNEDASSVTSTDAAADPKRPHKCARCGYAFKLATHLTSHMATVHSSGERPYVCDTCGLRYRSQGALSSHKVMHRRRKPYRCQKCGYRFARKWTLQRHELTHSGKLAHRCVLCGRRFAQLVNLELHLRSTHARERPHACTKCDGRFASAVKLRRHVSAVHSALRSKGKKRPSSRSDAGLAALAVADGDCRSDAAQLETPLADAEPVLMSSSKGKHRRFKPAVRGTVNALSLPATDRSRTKTSASGTASASRTVSSTEGNFVCSICSSCFDCKRSLWKHKQTHVGERLYGCLECGKCFSQRGNMNRHVRNVHKRKADAPTAAKASINRSRVSGGDGSDNADLGNTATVCRGRPPGTSFSSVSSHSESEEASREIAGCRAKSAVIDRAKADQRSSIGHRGQKGDAAKSQPVAMASRDTGTPIDDRCPNADTRAYDEKNSGCEAIIASCCNVTDRTDCASPSGTSKALLSSACESYTAGRRDLTADRLLPLNVSEAAVLAEPIDKSVGDVSLEQEVQSAPLKQGDFRCIEKSSHTVDCSREIVAVAQAEPERTRSQMAEYDGAGSSSLSTACQFLPIVRDAAGSSEVRTLRRLPSGADIRSNSSSPGICMLSPAELLASNSPEPNVHPCESDADDDRTYGVTLPVSVGVVGDDGRFLLREMQDLSSVEHSASCEEMHAPSVIENYVSCDSDSEAPSAHAGAGDTDLFWDDLFLIK